MAQSLTDIICLRTRYSDSNITMCYKSATNGTIREDLISSSGLIIPTVGFEFMWSNSSNSSSMNVYGTGANVGSDGYINGQNITFEVGKTYICSAIVEKNATNGFKYWLYTFEEKSGSSSSGSETGGNSSGTNNTGTGENNSGQISQETNGSQSEISNEYQPLLIKVGQSGAYSSSMSYSSAFDTKENYGLWIKHAPFSIMPKIKNIVTQSWMDEDGDDAYLPSTIRHEAYDLQLEFVYYENDNDSNIKFRAFINKIKGKWLKMYESYTGICRQGVYLIEVDEDPQFIRRGERDTVVWSAKFRVNDPSTNAKF